MPYPRTDYDAVRALIDVTLAEADLPDATIQLGPFEGAAIDEVTARDANAASYADGSANQKRVQRATELLTAAYLAPVMLRKTEESFSGGDYRYRRPENDAMKLAEVLRGRALQEMDAYLLPADEVTTIPVFAVAPGRRGA